MRISRWYLLLALLTVTLLACSGVYLTPVVKTNSQNRNCEFEVRTETPSGSYKEVGYISFGGLMYGTLGGPKNPVEAKNATRSEVCSVGGKILVLGPINGTGCYRTATILVPDGE
jgi:hypothetical protein